MAVYSRNTSNNTAQQKAAQTNGTIIINSSNTDVAEYLAANPISNNQIQNYAVNGTKIASQSIGMDKLRQDVLNSLVYMIAGPSYGGLDIQDWSYDAIDGAVGAGQLVVMWFDATDNTPINIRDTGIPESAFKNRLYIYTSKTNGLFVFVSHSTTYENGVNTLYEIEVGKDTDNNIVLSGMTRAMGGSGGSGDYDDSALKTRISALENAGYITQSTLNTASYITASQLPDYSSTYASIARVASLENAGQQAIGRLASLETSLNSYASIDYVDNQIDSYKVDNKQNIVRTTNSGVNSVLRRPAPAFFAYDDNKTLVTYDTSIGDTHTPIYYQYDYDDAVFSHFEPCDMTYYVSNAELEAALDNAGYADENTVNMYFAKKTDTTGSINYTWGPDSYFRASSTGINLRFGYYELEMNDSRGRVIDHQNNTYLDISYLISSNDNKAHL